METAEDASLWLPTRAEDASSSSSAFVDRSVAAMQPLHHRLLDDSGLDFEDVSGLTTLQVIRTSLRLYGSIFAVLFFLFVLGRRKYRAAFDVLNRDADTRTPLSARYGGWLSWIRLVFLPTDDDLFEHCGMDAVVFVRTLRYGLKVAAVGMFNSIYLIPVYATSGGTYAELESITLGNVPESSPALLSATLASYVVFGAAMHLLYKEFAWYTKRRHRFLARRRADNYTVFVKHIPPHLRTDDALLDYFRRVFSFDAVVDARVALDVHALEKTVAEREEVCWKLEHAINVLTVKGQRPRHTKMSKKGCCSGRGVGGETVDSIDAWTAKLERLNDEVSGRIDAIERERRKGSGGEDGFRKDLEMALQSSEIYQSAQKQRDRLSLEGTETKTLSGDVSINGEYSVAATAGGNSAVVVTSMQSTPRAHGSTSLTPSAYGPSVIFERSEVRFADEETVDDKSKLSDEVPPPAEQHQQKKKKKHRKTGSLDGVVGIGTGAVDGVMGIGTGAIKESTQLAKGAATMTMGAAKLATTFVLGGEDGTPRDAGFVSFATLRAKSSALQMIHHPTPFTLNVLEAPLPKDVFWGNVGLSHSSQQIGTIVAFVLTALLCIFWTVIVAFVTSLGEVENLTKLLPFLEQWLIAAPWLSMFFSQLKPLLLVLIVGWLPPILTAFSKREGHISEATLSASLFGKLSVFLLIQIFFVQMISGTLWQELQEMIKDPLSIITLLAEALPQQAQSFMQYVIVQTSLRLGLEIARLTPIVMAWIRGKFGPNLTEKERKEPWFGLTALSVPPELDYADVQSGLILYYMIMFVYSVLSPIMAFIMGAVFFLFSMCYRNQLIYVYSTENDTGGQLFPHFANLVMTCVIVAEITMFGVLSLKKAPVAATLVIPLFVITVGFNMYLKQQHFHVTKHLPSIHCVQEDLRNVGEVDLDFLKGEYLQPALQTRYLQPENMSVVRRASSKPESMHFFTPEHSQAEEAEHEA